MAPLWADACWFIKFPRWLWWAAKSGEHSCRPCFRAMETSWLEDSNDTRTQLPSSSYEDLPAPHWQTSLFLSADRTISSALGRKFFSEATTNFVESAPYPVSIPPGKASTYVMFIITPTSMTCLPILNVNLQNSVNRAHWTGEEEANAASKLLGLWRLTGRPN